MCIIWSPASAETQDPGSPGLPHTAPGLFQVVALLSAGASSPATALNASSVFVNTLFTAVLVPVLPFTLVSQHLPCCAAGGGGFIGFMESSADWRPWDTRLTAA